MSAPRILVVDDERGMRDMLSVLLRRAGFEVTLCEGTAPALTRIANEPPFDVVLTDLLMPDGSGMAVIEAARRRDESTQVIVITAHGSTEHAVEAMRRGAYDFVQKPFRTDELRATIDKALEKRSIVDENRALREQLVQSYRHGPLVGKSAAMQAVAQLVARVASTSTTVLITGESGTGKEVVARALHELGDRRAGPFVAVNCGALPEALMESELFGHERGAFTGASAAKEGLFRAAHGGTLFLDEVAELTPPLQVKLLRALQERRVRPVGADREVEVDTRVVAATNRDVQAELDAGRLRRDLFFRLAVIRIHLPPLRDRPEDIPLLAEHFLRRHSTLLGRRLSFSDAALRWLAARDYPGNVRELQNVVERAATLAAGPRIEPADLEHSESAAGRPPGSAQEASMAPATSSALWLRQLERIASNMPTDGVDLDVVLTDVERRLLLAALERTGGNRTAAARLLGTTFRSFRYRLAKHGLASDHGRDETEEPRSG